MFMFLKALVSIAWFCTAPCFAVYTPFGNAVRLASIQSLSFVKGKETAHRRSSAVPQLLCVKGCDYEPAFVQCKNVRSYGRDVTWECEAELPSQLSFSDIEVSCEGYSSKEDEDVLEGSCGLKYSLSSSHGPKRQWNFLRTVITACVIMCCFYFMWNPRTLWQILQMT